MTPRKTLCERTVDLTTEAQRASHKLREASLCSQCLAKHTRLTAAGNEPDVDVVFAERGKRRHWAVKA